MSASHLPEPIGEAMESKTDAVRLQRMWRGVERLQDGRIRRRKLVVRGAALALAAAALLGIGYLGGQRGTQTESTLASAERGPLRLEDGGRLPSELTGPQTLRFDDGSEVALHDGHLEVVENRPSDFVLMQHEGSARFRVRPNTGRGWWIECGLATVRVVGTEFAIERGEGHLRVSVEEGTVAVRSSLLEGGVRMLRGGEQLELTEAQPEAERATTNAGSTVATPTPPTDAQPEEAADSPRGRAWAHWAERGDYSRAWSALGEGGIERRTTTASAADLLALADVARRSGHDEAAIAPLQRLLERHPADPDAALGAFTLGRIHSRREDPRAAAGAFERALSLRLPQSLVGDALARLAHARDAYGDHARAAQAARRYLRVRPDGPHADAMQRLSEAR